MIIQLCDWQHRDLTSKVETNIKIEKLRLIIAYLQLLKSQLPCFTYTEKTLMPQDVASLLVKFYECKAVTGITKFDEAINVDFDIKDVLQLETSFTDTAKAGIRHAILVLLKNEIEQKLTDPFILATEELRTLLNHDLEKLHHLLETGKALAEWELKTSEQKNCYDQVFDKDKINVDIPCFNISTAYSFDSYSTKVHCINIDNSDKMEIQPSVEEWISKITVNIKDEVKGLCEVELCTYRHDSSSILDAVFSDTTGKYLYALYFFTTDEYSQLNIDDNDSIFVSDLVDAFNIVKLIISRLESNISDKKTKLTVNI